MNALFNILTALAVFVVLAVLSGVVLALFFSEKEKKEEQRSVSVKETNLRAFVKCAGGCNSEKRYTYADVSDCDVAASLYGGMSKCTFACLGFGTCVSSCKRGAINIDGGVAVVDESLCDGCGECVGACPRSIIELLPKNIPIAVACRNDGEKYEIEKICADGCIGCGVCENTCQYGAIKVIDNCAVIDYEKCTACGACAEVCERGVISGRKSEVVSEVFVESEEFEQIELLTDEK